jgi:inosine-uridine nucleoside N-ribohydrolase
MAGLDVTHQFLVTPERIATVDALDTPFTTMIADLFRFFSTNYISRYDHIRGAALHDPLAVLALTHPDLFEGTDRHVTIETRGEHTAGMTVIDRRDISDRDAPERPRARPRRRRRAWQLVLGSLRAATSTA